MKKLIIASLLIVGMTGFAQESTPKPNRAEMEKLTPEQRNQKRLEKLTKELSLNANQQAQVGQIIKDQSVKKEAMKAQREANKANPVKPTPEQKSAFKSKMMDEKNANDAKMKSILSDDQYKKWTVLREEKKEKFKKRKCEKKG